MPRQPKTKPPTRLVHAWPLPPAATLGSAVRAKGILLEMRAHLPFRGRKRLGIVSGVLELRVPEDDADDHAAAVSIVTKRLEGVEALPVIPREVEDILAIRPAERHRWLKDGRLQSVGTRTVKLRGRARKITFHVFDPRHVEELMDRDMPEIWREQDRQAAAENRRRGAQKAALKRAARKQAAGSSGEASRDAGVRSPPPSLKGWDDFDLDGLLR